jgi:hypothetical protein
MLDTIGYKLVYLRPAQLLLSPTHFLWQTYAEHRQRFLG